MSGEEAPTFIVELTYIQRGAAWTEKGDAHVELPTSDLPVSRSVLALHFSPRYAVDARPAHFASRRIPALARRPAGCRRRRRVGVGRRGADGTRAEKDLQALMDRYKKESGRSRQGTVPDRDRISPRSDHRSISPRS